MPKREKLTPDETVLLRHYHNTLRENEAKRNDSYAEDGRILKDIRDKRLYREDYSSFESYCRCVWDISRTRAHELITASGIARSVRHAEQSPNARQATELAKAPIEKQPEIWMAVRNKHGNSITAEKVKQMVGWYTEPPKKPVPSDDAVESDNRSAIKIADTPEPADETAVPNGKGLLYANDAINNLKRIRPNDPERIKGLDLVTRWIECNRNRENKRASELSDDSKEPHDEGQEYLMALRKLCGSISRSRSRFDARAFTRAIRQAEEILDASKPLETTEAVAV